MFLWKFFGWSWSEIGSTHFDCRFVASLISTHHHHLSLPNYFVLWIKNNFSSSFIFCMLKVSSCSGSKSNLCNLFSRLWRETIAKNIFYCFLSVGQIVQNFTLQPLAVWNSKDWILFRKLFVSLKKSCIEILQKNSTVCPTTDLNSKMCKI